MIKYDHINQTNRTKKLLFFVLAVLSMQFSHARHSIKQEKLQIRPPLPGNGMRFTPNKGQIADMNGKPCLNVLYKGEGDGADADIYLRKTGISYVYNNIGEVMQKVGEQVENLINAGTIGEADRQKKKDELLQKESIKVHRVDMDFAGCNKNIHITNEDELDGYQNFYYGHCPNGITNVKQCNKVTYKNIYNNIDINYCGSKKNSIKYDFIIQPHADPNQIKLHWQGAESIHINSEGNLVIKTSVNEFYESIPKVYQVINGKSVDVKAKYKLLPLAKKESPTSLLRLEKMPASGVQMKQERRESEALVAFELGTWNREFPLVIDPWATYYGGNQADYNSGIATDNTGNVIITGFNL
ncbi:MAG: hypothetical protein HYU69_15170, partial [Bacteroidetes bacterium]|nr:hypothetical protein [Bacteroidota bacterium]